MPDGDEWDDLAANVAGQQVGREANRRRAAEGAGADRSWRIGAEGEHRVGEVLDTLGRVSWLDRLRGRQPQWHVLHSVPVGTGKSDIDHVVIGPPGVIVINTKHHRNKYVAIDGDTLIIGRERTQHVAKSQAEAKLATRLLQAALTETNEPELATKLTVRPLLALVGVRLADKSRPGGVIVATLDNLLMCLRNLPTMLDPAEVDTLFNIAHRSTTWTQTPARQNHVTEKLPGQHPSAHQAQGWLDEERWAKLVNHIKDMHVQVLAAGGLIPPLMFVYRQNVPLGVVRLRPIHRGSDAVTGIIGMGHFAAATHADEVVVAWETQDVAVACEAPPQHPGKNLNVVRAVDGGHVYHRFPYRQQPPSRSD